MSYDEPQRPVYKRVLVKFSGEVLADEHDHIAPVVMRDLATQIKEIHELGVQVAIVIGGGNIWRGMSASNKGMDRTAADYMGMLATVINGLALQDALEQQNVYTRVQTAIQMQNVAEPFIRRRAIRHLQKGRVVIFVAGTGNPYFTTDTTAALRANEINANIILKATKVDGVYDKDPKQYPDAVKYEKIKYLDALKLRLKVMDSTAFSLCMDNLMPILVFNVFKKGTLKAAIMGEQVGTIVTEE